VVENLLPQEELTRRDSGWPIWIEEDGADESADAIDPELDDDSEAE
jgi:hypothetical protein